jgi:hypothetical protein
MASQMGVLKTSFSLFFFVGCVLRSVIENDKCMADGMKAVEGLLTPLLPRDVMAVIRLHWAFPIVSCLERDGRPSIWLL